MRILNTVAIAVPPLIVATSRASAENPEPCSGAAFPSGYRPDGFRSVRFQFQKMNSLTVRVHTC